MSVENVAETSAVELQRYLHAHIPISAAMGVEVDHAAASGVRLRAPLEPNINHRSTVFGGSASAVAILAGWTLLHVRLSHGGHGSRIVIQNSYVHYDAPIDDEFEAVALPPPDEAWGRFVRTLERRGKARIEIRVVLEQAGRIAGGLTASYVVVPFVAPEAG
jgi:thioesterase domain-containing protein